MQSAIKHLVLGTLFLFNLFAVVGCGSMCASTPDCEFHAYGGLRDRQDRVNGRVASLFDPAIASPGYVPEEAPLPPAEPEQTDDRDEEATGDDDADTEKEPWEKELQKELDEMKLPTDEIPDAKGDGSGSDSGDSFEEI